MRIRTCFYQETEHISKRLTPLLYSTANFDDTFISDGLNRTAAKLLPKIRDGRSNVEDRLQGEFNDNAHFRATYQQGILRVRHLNIPTQIIHHAHHRRIRQG